MDRTQQAISKAKSSFILMNPKWKDRNYRIKVWQLLNPFQKQDVLDFLTQIANEDLDTPYPF